MSVDEYVVGPLLDYILQQVDGIIKNESDDLDAEIYNKIYEQIYEEAVIMFHTFIDIYYSYQTKKYSRHGTGVGTGTGESLYNVEDFIFSPMSSGGAYPDLNFQFNFGALPGYKHDDNYTVWSIVAQGGRGLPGKKGFKRWSGSYSGPLFSYSGHIKTVYENLSKQAETIADSHFDEYLDENTIQQAAVKIVGALKTIIIAKFRTDLEQGVITLG